MASVLGILLLQKVIDENSKCMFVIHKLFTKCNSNDFLNKQLIRLTCFFFTTKKASKKRLNTYQSAYGNNQQM